MESTTIGLMLCKPNLAVTPDPHYCQHVPLVAWTVRRGANGVYHLTYYNYIEDPPVDRTAAAAFAHTAALLQKLAPVSVVHVCSEEKRPTASAGGVLRSLVQWLESELPVVEASQDDLTKRVQQHSTSPVSADCLGRLAGLLQNMQHGSSSLQTAGDLEFQSNTCLRKCLVFTFQQTGLWDAAGTTSDHGSVVIQSGHLESCLSADRTAAAALHLWPPAGGWGGAHHAGGQTHSQSVAGVLAAPLQTVAGHRLLECWLRQPLVSLPAIVERQEAVAVLVQRSVGRDAIREQGLRLFKQGDAFKLVCRLAEYATAQDNGSDGPGEDANMETASFSTTTRKALQTLYELYLVSSQKLPLLLEQVERALVDEDHTSRLLLDQVMTPLRLGLSELERSVDLCTAVLDLNAAPREFLVKPEYKEELLELQQELVAVQAELEACHEQMNETWSDISGTTNAVKLETTAGDCREWQFRLVNTNDSKLLQQQLGSSVIVHRLLKNGVYFSTKQLRHLTTKKQDLCAEYDRHQRQVAMDALKVAATYSGVLAKVGHAVALLDVLTALAHVAAYSPHGYCRPILTDGDDDNMGLQLTGARHPCIELQENMEFIPNDVRLAFGDASFLLVTGPNSTWNLMNQ
jgi:DNA mismatch repair protein MSH2